MSFKKSAHKFVVAFTGGGTGGHVFPGLAIISYIKNYLQSSAKLDIPELFWIGSKKGPEKKFVTQYDIEYKSISTGKLRRYLSFQNLLDPFKIILGILQSIFILKKNKPNLIVSIGGYVSVPCVLAAQWLKVPVISICCDFSLGLATKINFIYSHFILCAYKETAEKLHNNPRYQKMFSKIAEKRIKYFKQKNITDDFKIFGTFELRSMQSWIIYSGMPLRPEIFNANPKIIDNNYDIKNNNTLILVLGGSMGSTQINQIVSELLPRLDDSIMLVHQFGSQKLLHPTQNHTCKYVPIDFIKSDYPNFLARADIIIARAGAGSLWEIIANAKPSIIIPLSKTNSRGDQIENAEYFSRKKAIINLGTEPKLNDIIKAIESVINDQSVRAEISTACKNFDLSKVVSKIWSLLYMYSEDHFGIGGSFGTNN